MRRPCRGEGHPSGVRPRRPAVLSSAQMPEPLSPSGRTGIPVGHGELEALLPEPPAAVAAAVVCHPHPRGGGTMNNNVVYRLAKALGARGVTALRFNFRGGGAPTGRYA